MKNYKSFIGEKILENSSSQEWKSGFLRAIEDNLIIFGPSVNQELEDSIEIGDNGLILHGDLRIKSKFTGSSLEELPFKIQEIHGDLNCFGIDTLKSLKGSPRFCSQLNVNRCDLRSLEGSPEMVRNFSASYNLIRDIKGSPKYVFGDFDLSNNLIKDLNFGPLIVTGSCKLLGNPATKKYVDPKLFSNMHREITYNYLVTYGDLYSEAYKTINNINDAIKDQSYVINLLMKNPDFDKFLGRFQKDVDEYNHIRTAKEFGVI